MRIAFIPDVQARPGLDFAHLTHIGRYIADHRPDVIVQAGDFADMESLSSYDKGRKEFEGRRYTKDIDSAKWAMETLMEPIRRVPGYDPRLVLTLGNHCDRINRAVSAQPELDGLISTDDLEYQAYGWEVYPFLEVVMIGGVAFSHYFTSGVMGRPINTAAATLAKKYVSCVAGHQQTYDIARRYRADGKAIIAIIAGAAYKHTERYLGPQGNNHWRGILFLNDVRDGEFEEMPLTLNYLKRRYA